MSSLSVDASKEFTVWLLWMLFTMIAVRRGELESVDEIHELSVCSENLTSNPYK